ncbi:TPA: hypothetical protein ACU967_005973 [Burkholderia contaminans]|uniref:hypothetical protein n=1 Tax=Burkholderia TaxID=32008 RepID=UPI000B157135|nr:MULTISPECIES: hypothetical protein [Burkholderia]MBM6430587.1 hypothetical protein [Burkholderia contaminans]MCA7880830.1 hypothetical protein [Burkholderia contaminans]MCB4349266.1 hypothetical protein [Burkholderia vietnamiensis]MDN8025846.1 hypothetical protein [Burkholderia contaminans]HDR9037954.1 hypothetical protein [Burkholderia vietnamiensis]
MGNQQKNQIGVDVRQLLDAAADAMWARLKASGASKRPDHKGLPPEAAIRERPTK